MTDRKFSIMGKQLIAIVCPIAVDVKLNSPNAKAIPLLIVKQINAAFEELYITTTTTSSTNLKLLIGLAAQLNISPPASQVQLVDTLGSIMDPLMTGAYDPVGAAWQRLHQVWDGVRGLLPTEAGSATDVFRPHRRGQLLFADGFESLCNWSQDAGTVARSTTAGEVYHGTGSLKLTTGAVAGNAATASITVPVPSCKRAWAKVVFGAQVSTNLRTFDLTFTWYDYKKAYVVIAGLQLDQVNTRWNYWDTTAAWLTTGTLNPRYYAAASWQSLMVDIDVSNLKYGSCDLDGKWVDLSAKAPQSAGAGPPYSYAKLTVSAVTNAAAAISVNVDDVVVSGVEYLT